MVIQRTLPLVLAALLLGGCAAYKELQPDPEIIGTERGYVELKTDEKDFELEKDTRYFMKFPPPASDNFYLVLTTRGKRALVTTFSPTFDDAPVTEGAIGDENTGSDSISVFAIHPRVLTYYWVIDTVRYDMRLPLTYRYVPQWRYTFETKYSAFKQTFADNTVDRRTYQSINRNASLDAFDLDGTLAELDDRRSALEGVNGELHRIESIFPPGIAASGDTAYRNWQALRTAVDDEVRFQNAYASSLSLFKRERDTRGNVTKFIEALPFFVSTLTDNPDLTTGVREKSRDLLLGRLAEVQRYYEEIVRSKTDLRPITPDPPRERIAQLYGAFGQEIPASMALIVRFVNRFNIETVALQRADTKFNELKSVLQRGERQVNEAMITDILTRAGEIKQTLQDPQCTTIERWGTSACAVALTDAVTRSRHRADDLVTMYEAARVVAASLDARSWGHAEAGLVDLYEAKTIHDRTAFADHRALLLKRFEESLFTGVQQATVTRVDSFVRLQQMTIEDVPALYADSAFLPVYQLSFSSAGPNDLLTKRKQIDGYLSRMKYVTFPEAAIKAVYGDFVRNPGQRGVEKARAVVEHGKMYRGNDKRVKTMVDECDPLAPKWITAPKEYRKMFVLPITSNRQGANDYIFRIRLQIPSEAQFPVYDLNIKLPQELVANARQAQWYDEITLNKTPVKNEGRFRITAPGAENNYESQITPVQMDKAGANVLEVKFKYKGFRVFEISAMAQVPIIRKN